MPDISQTSNPMTSIEQQAKFIRWRDQLEERLAWHLFNANIKDETPSNPKRVVEVSEVDHGAWEVYMNGKKIFHFTGIDAHSRALKASTELANG